MCKLSEISAELGKGQGLGACGWQGPRGSRSPGQHPRSGHKPCRAPGLLPLPNWGLPGAVPAVASSHKCSLETPRQPLPSSVPPGGLGAAWGSGWDTQGVSLLSPRLL